MENFPHLIHTFSQRFGISIESESFKEENTEEFFLHIHEMLSTKIEEMLRDDFSGLVQKMYQLDIDEAKFRQALDSPGIPDAAWEIASLVIARQKQKWHT